MASASLVSKSYATKHKISLTRMFALNIGLGALVGLGVGALFDKITNKAKKQQADFNAQLQ